MTSNITKTYFLNLSFKDLINELKSTFIPTLLLRDTLLHQRVLWVFCFVFFNQRITLKKKKIDSMVELQRLTYPESLLLFEWVEGDGRRARVSQFFPASCTKQPCNRTAVIYAPTLRIHRKLVSGKVTNELWEEDTDALRFCPLLFTTKAILQAVYHLCITAPWQFLFFFL